MGKKVKVSLPINVQPAEMHLFEPYLQYELPWLKIKKLKNVFVTNSGLCINRNGLVKESHHEHPHQLDDFRTEAAIHYYNAKEIPGNLIILDDDNTYLLIHHPWYNYYHWLCECILRAWMVKDETDEFILLLPDYYEKSDFIMGSLEPFGFSQIYFIPAGKNLMVRSLCMPQMKPKVDSYDRKMLQQIHSFYIDYVNERYNINLGERLYISRRKANRKRVANEEAIESVLTKWGFTIINNEDYTFLQQVAIYSNARYLISIHGSGLTNMLFMKAGSTILEFHKKLTNDKDWHSKAFWYLADAMGFDYYQQICEPTDLNDDYFNANFIVDSETLEHNLELIFKGS